MNTQLVVHHRALNDDEAAAQVGLEVADTLGSQGMALTLGALKPFFAGYILQIWHSQI